MSNANYWEKYIEQVVVVQLRTQPYIGITGEEMVPATNGEDFHEHPSDARQGCGGP